MSLLGREFSQEAFEFMGEEPGWGSALGKLPKIEVLKDVLNHTRLFDHRDDLKAVATLGTRQRIHLIDLAEEPCPTAPPLLGIERGG